MKNIHDFERHLLGICVNFNDSIPEVIKRILVTDFHAEEHRNIFIAIAALHAGGAPVEFTTLAGKLTPAEIAVVVEASDMATTSANLNYYIKHLLKDTRSRKVSELALKLSGSPDDSQLQRLLKEATTDSPETSDEPSPARSKSMFISAIEFLQNSIAIAWLIYGRIPQNSTGQIFGPSGGGKTFNALDVSLATVTGGHALNGCKAQKGLVLYLAGEGHDGLRRRVKAWQIHHKKTVEDLSLFYLSRNTISFNAPDISAVVAEGRALSELHSSSIALIVIDTLARHLEGDENSTRDMGAFIIAVDALRTAFPGSVALIVHHSGHGEDTKTRARGSSALKGAMDFEIMCDKGLLTFTKLKDGEAPPPIEFKLHPVQIGTDEDGEPIASCVVTYGERSVKNRESELTKYERLLLGLVTGNPDILIGDLRDSFYAKRKEREPDAKSDTLKRAFQRSLDGLIDKKIIIMDGHTVKAGLSDKAGHLVTMSRQGNGTADISLKGCPNVPLEIEQSEDLPSFL